MTLERELIDYLLGISELSSLVSGRIMAGILSVEAKLPAISFIVKSSSNARPLTGCAIATPMVDFNIWAERTKDGYSKSVEIGQILKENLDGQVEFLDTVKVLGAFFQDEKDLVDEQAVAVGRGQVFKIIYAEQY